MANVYKDAIAMVYKACLEQKDRDLLMQILCNEPGAILRAAERVYSIPTSKSRWPTDEYTLEVIYSCCAKGKKLDAIRTLRNATDMSLKEAKEEIERFMAKKGI